MQEQLVFQATLYLTKEPVMAITKSTLVVSKAGKAKNRKWDAQSRFSTGHDAASRSLLTDEIRRSNPKRPVGVYRSPTFGMSREEREYHDVKHLLDHGIVEDVDEAVAIVRQALDRKWELG